MRTRARRLLGRQRPAPTLPADFDDWTRPIVEHVVGGRFTMTSAARVYAVCKGVEHVVRNEIDGAIVECGVWRGGSMMAAALTLNHFDVDDRELYLFDTFEGMPAATEVDVDVHGDAASALLAEQPDLARSGLDEVRANMASTGYPSGRVHYVSGMVEETLPAAAPEAAALVRLDTDWYESTKHELVHLAPRIPSGGLLIIDDYGYWRGSRTAVDEYIAETHRPWFLNRVDDESRLVVIP